MFVYIVPIFILLAGIIQCDLIGSKRSEKPIWGLLFLYLTLIIGLRYGLGGDTLNYMGDYQWRVPLKDWKPDLFDHYQPGYVFLCSLAKTVSEEFYVFQIVHVLLFNTLLFLFISRNSESRFFCFLCVYVINYIYFTTEILRESLAVMVFIFNYRNVEDGRWVRYYLGVLLGCMFHISSVALVVVPFLKWLKFDKYYVYMVFVACLSAVGLEKIFNIIASVAMVGDKLSLYKDLGSIGMFAGLMNLLRRTVFPIAFVLLVKYGMKEKVKFETPIAIMTLAGISAFFFPLVFGRLVNYFMVFFAVSFGDSMIRLIKSNVKVLINNARILVVLFLMVYLSNHVMYRTYERFIPYYSIFNPVSVDRDNYD